MEENQHVMFFLFYKIPLRAPISNAETHTQKLLGVKTGRVYGSSKAFRDENGTGTRVK